MCRDQCLRVKEYEWMWACMYSEDYVFVWVSGCVVERMCAGECIDIQGLVYK